MADVRSENDVSLGVDKRLLCPYPPYWDRNASKPLHRAVPKSRLKGFLSARLEALLVADPPRSRADIGSTWSAQTHEPSGSEWAMLYGEPCDTTGFGTSPTLQNTAY